METLYVRDAVSRRYRAAPKETILETASVLRAKPIIGTIHSPASTKEFLADRLADKPYEVFCCLFMDNRHRVIAFEELFRGTIDQTMVHPREIIRVVLAHNAAAVILAHNHPSGHPDPSDADQTLTRRIKSALDMIDVRVLDHIVVGSDGSVSLAERGLI